MISDVRFFGYFYSIYSKKVSSQHKIPWEESFGHLAIWPDPQRPATTSSILPHSTGSPWLAYFQSQLPMWGPTFWLVPFWPVIICPSQQRFTTLNPLQSSSAPFEKWYIDWSISQIREQMSVPDLYVVTVGFLALKKTGFSEIKFFPKIFFFKF